MQSTDLFATREILTPSELNRRARGLLESGLGELWLEGEISNLSTPASGHRYFTLKDARAQVRCALFRNRPVSTPMADGHQVLVRARVSLYEARGEYQLIVEAVEAAGEGRLRQAFEALKKKLAAEGLFDAQRRPLPRFPRHLAVISSPTGAAVKDVLSVISRRYPAVRISLVPSPVQGDQAPAALRAALARAEALAPDVILLTRGGGSLEDLWAFNDEALARQIHACTVPVVSAVGHEVDFSISDFVADVRAATPSAAAELLVPDRQELLNVLDAARRRMGRCTRSLLEQQTQRVDHLQQRLLRAGPAQRLQRARERLSQMALRARRIVATDLTQRQQRLAQVQHRFNRCSPALRIGELAQKLEPLQQRRTRAMALKLQEARSSLAMAARSLNAVNPLAVLERGYSVTVDADGQVLTDASTVKAGSQITSRLANGSIHSTVLASETENPSESS